MTITYKTDLQDVNWDEVKTKVAEDDFDNGRTPQQLQKSFENSFATCIAYDDDQIVGKVRALSDGVCNAYVVDVWTYTPYRHQGIASQMMQILFEQLPGQHIYLFTDDALEFYEALGFEKQGIGLGKVVGNWLETNP
jgi:ribosomal protein S18 acetylase RimI-like enzyme